jgi:hypothetical protein
MQEVEVEERWWSEGEEGIGWGEGTRLMEISFPGEGSVVRK